MTIFFEKFFATEKERRPDLNATKPDVLQLSNLHEFRAAEANFLTNLFFTYDDLHSLWTAKELLETSMEIQLVDISGVRYSQEDLKTLRKLTENVSHISKVCIGLEPKKVDGSLFSVEQLSSMFMLAPIEGEDVESSRVLYGYLGPVPTSSVLNKTHDSMALSKVVFEAAIEAGCPVIFEIDNAQLWVENCKTFVDWWTQSPYSEVRICFINNLFKCQDVKCGERCNVIGIHTSTFDTCAQTGNSWNLLLAKNPFIKKDILEVLFDNKDVFFKTTPDSNKMIFGQGISKRTDITKYGGDGHQPLLQLLAKHKDFLHPAMTNVPSGFLSFERKKMPTQLVYKEGLCCFKCWKRFENMDDKIEKFDHVFCSIECFKNWKKH